jgi:Ca-activated chloride channel family protein
MNHPVYNTFLAGICILFLVPDAGAVSVAGQVDRGNKAYKTGNFDQAADLYQQALIIDPKSASVEYDLGTAFYKKGDYANALGHLQKALLTEDPLIAQQVHFNLGNTLYMSGISLQESNIQQAIDQLEKSLGYFQKVLNAVPKDTDAKSNYDFVKNELERLKQKQKEQQQQKQSQKQDQEKKDENNQDSDKNQQEHQDKKDNKDSQSNKDQNDQKKPDQQDKKDPKPQDNSANPNQKNNPQENKDQNNDGQKKQEQPKNNGKPEAKEQPSDENKAPNPEASGPQGQGMMTPQEAQMFLNDYQRNEEPKGMLYFIPQDGKDKPVNKDW